MSTAPEIAAPDTTEASKHPWWRGAVTYQIYPRSFADSNGDGVGDLPGITRRLDYVASLGVDAIWLSPFFTSPQKDYGYDVADYRDVDPLFGTLADFDALLARAHGLGLKVVIDQVYSHTSDEHPWFAESRSSRDNPKADWYVWADAKPDGTPPNNWQSVFGGPAWTWDARRGQYYLHNFLREQPQLHVHHPEVQQALLDTAKFWLDRGVDGFRLDAINFAMHDPALRDNPPAPDTGRPRTRPFDFQQRLYNQSHAGIPAFLERLRTLMDRYDERFTVAEIGGENATEEMRLYTQGESRLNTAYNFSFLYMRHLTPAKVIRAVEDWFDEAAGWPSWAFENHDAPRAVSRWCDPAHRHAFARAKMLLLAALRGNIFIYNGEELGLTQVDIPFERLRDPEAIANWPMTLSRDGARTPMPWASNDPQLGFSSVEPWLPLGEDHVALAVNRQDGDPDSLLNHTRRVLAFRRESEALMHGDLHVVEATDALLVFERRAPGQTMLCAFNLSPGSARWTPAKPDRWRVAEAVNGAADWSFPPYGALIAEKVL
ncbi:MAG TPA: alpha-glucosidase [Sphingomonas sp.]|jgi:alpha-glucosidase